MESAWLAQDEDHGLCKASSKLLVIQLCQCLWLTLSSKFRLTCENISEVLFVAMVSTWLKSMLCCASCSVSKQFAIPKQGNDVELLKDRRRAVQSMTFSVWVWCILMYHMGHIYLAQWSCRPCMKRKKNQITHCNGNCLSLSVSECHLSCVLFLVLTFALLGGTCATICQKNRRARCCRLCND